MVSDLEPHGSSQVDPSLKPSLSSWQGDQIPEFHLKAPQESVTLGHSPASPVTPRHPYPLLQPHAEPVSPQLPPPRLQPSNPWGVLRACRRHGGARCVVS